MSLFKNMDTPSDVQQEKDTLGAGKFDPWESGAYDVVIDLAYEIESKNGAKGVCFNFKTKDGKELSQTIYATSGKEKNQLNYYVSKDGAKHYLPGFILINDIALLTLGEEIKDLDTETKVLSIYNYEAKKELPTKSEVFVDLLGKDVTLGIQKVLEDKYNKPGETRTVNVISKVFREADKKTTNEVRSESAAEFYPTWVEKNAGILVNKVGKSKQETPFTPDDKPKKSLFSK
jgi:hypothetical protein